MSLKHVYNILQEIAAESSTNEKIKLIKKYSTNNDFKKVVFYALDYNIVYNTNQVKYLPTEKIHCSNESIYKYLNELSMQNGASLADKKYLSQLASCDQETVEVVSRIVKKDLRCGSSIKTFLKVFPNLPYFEMMTCTSDIDKYLKLIKKENTKAYWSPKKDGVRTWGIVKNPSKGGEKDKFKYLSRSGLSYFNFSCFDHDLNTIQMYLTLNYNIPWETPIDGEVTILNGNFQDVMKNIRTIDEDQSKIKYHFNIFDIAIEGIPFEKRYQMLKDVMTDNPNPIEHCSLLKHELVENTNEDSFKEIMNSAVLNGDEGIVLKLANSPYEFKEKSKYWLKMKPVETYDLLVVGTYKGKEGKKFDNTLGGLIVKFNDKEVHVGSGFTEEERKEFLENPPKMIEVNCKGITNDGSLREPRFIRIRNDKLTTTDRS